MRRTFWHLATITALAGTAFAQRAPDELTRVAATLPIDDLAKLVDRDDISIMCARSRLDRTTAPRAYETIRAAPEGQAFLGWLLNDREVLEDLLYAGAPPTDAEAVVMLLFRIWSSDRACERGLESRLAVAVALEHARPVIPWSEWDDKDAKPIDAVARYAFFRDANKAGTLFACFKSLATWELRRVVDIPLYDDDVAWYHANLTTGKDGKDLRSQRAVGDAMWLIKYRDRNEQNGHSVQEGKPYYDGKRWTPAVILEYGGVCGAVSKFGSFAARAFGVPSQPLGQIGHCAMAWKALDDHWITGNCSSDHDWEPSNLHGLWGTWTTRGAVIPLFVELEHDANYYRSMRVAELARAQHGDESELRTRLLGATRLCPQNVALWMDLAALYVADAHAPPEEGLRIMTSVAQSLAAYPQLALDVIATIDQRPDSPLHEADAQLAVLRAFRIGAKDRTGADGDGVIALRELVGHGILRVSLHLHQLPPWPYREHVDALNGITPGIGRLVKRLDDHDRSPIYRYAEGAIEILDDFPSVSEHLAERLMTSAETNESARPVALRAVTSVIDRAVARGDRKRALELAREGILAGERMADAAWTHSLTTRALALREE